MERVGGRMDGVEGRRKNPHVADVAPACRRVNLGPSAYCASTILGEY